MKYKVSIQLDELLKEKKISQYSLIKKTNLSHNFINKLVKHKEVANLDKLATIINALNDEGADIRPSDLIKFVPVDETTVDIFSSQRFDDSFYFFFMLKHQRRPYFDLAKLTIEKSNDDTILIRLEANDTPLYKFSDKMQKAISAQSFYLSKGVEALVQLPSSGKRAAAQAFTEETLTQALEANIIPKKSVYQVYFSYFEDFAITFNHIEQKDNKIHIIKDKNDSLVPRYPEAYKTTYPFMHAFSIGKVEKGEHFTKPKPRKLSAKDQQILDILFSAPNQHK